MDTGKGGFKEKRLGTTALDNVFKVPVDVICTKTPQRGVLK